MNEEQTGQTQVELTIDGQKVTAAPETTILEAARSIGIEIPTLCYHARLTSIGSCRVCLVKLDGYADPVASCTTPVSAGLVVTTVNDDLSRLRKQAIQYLLLNHPLECPVCDKAGECELQDVTFELDVHEQKYRTAAQTWENDTNSPLIFRSDARCIRCGRCVAICNEVQDVGAIDFVLRGYDTHIAPVNGDVLDCEFCGQCVSVCPVGALILKPFLNSVRIWDVERTPTVCAFCGAGCSVEAQTRNGALHRVVSERGTTHNNGDLCVRGTFGFQFVESDKRQQTALVKGKQAQVGDAIEKAVDRLKSIVGEYGPSAVAGIGSARMPNEEAYAFSHFMKEIVGTTNLDTEAGLGYRQMHQQAYDRPIGTFNDLESCDAILVFGSDLAVEMPVPALRVIAAAKRHDGQVVTATPYKTKLHKSSRSPLVNKPGGEAALALALATVAVKDELVSDAVTQNAEFAKIKDGLNYDLAALCERAGITEQQVRTAAGTIFHGSHRAVIVGSYGYNNKENREAVALLTWLIDPEVFLLSGERANIQGVTNVGCHPGEGGKDYQQILEGVKAGEIKALWVAGSDPAALLGQYAEALARLDLLIVQDPFFSQTAKVADYYLPTASWGQKSGIYTSTEGRVQNLGSFLPLGDGLLTDKEIFQKAAEAFNPEAEKIPELAEQATEGDEDAAAEKKAQTPMLPQTPQSQAQNGFVLLRGASLYLNGTLGSHCEHLRTICPEAYLALSAKKLAELGVRDGDHLKVSTEAGGVEVAVKLDNNISDEVGLIIDQFPDSGVSALFTGCASYTSAKLEKI